jgi:hypothetical protein
MKKLTLFAVIASALFFSCQKNSSPAPDAKNVPGGITSKNQPALTTDVYVAGYTLATNSRTLPAYWKNGVLTTLPSNPAFSASTSSIAVSGTDVYVAGADNNTACYWKNGVEHVFPQPNPNFPVSYAAGIAISATGDVYIVGSYVAGFINSNSSYNVAVMWKNNVMSLLAFNKFGSLATGIYIDGSDVYVCGSAVVNNGEYDIPIYWKNNIWHPFIHNYPDNGQPIQGLATAITLDGNHNFYMTGGQQPTFGAPNFVPCYWKDANFVTFNGNPGTPITPHSIAVDNSQSVYIGDPSPTIPAVYVKNGVRKPITGSRGPINGIAVSDGDVYTAGFSASLAPDGGEVGAYFKNNTPVILEGNGPFPTAIIVVKH